MRRRTTEVLAGFLVQGAGALQAPRRETRSESDPSKLMRRLIRPLSISATGWLAYRVRITITGPHAVSRMLPIA